MRVTVAAIAVLPPQVQPDAAADAAVNEGAVVPVWQGDWPKNHRNGR